MTSKQKALVDDVKRRMNEGEVNAPPTEEFVMNSRGTRLHVRSDWTKAIQSLGEAERCGPGVDESHRIEGNKSAIIVLLHGMGGHTNRPSFVHVANYYNTLGYKVVAFDFHGHGYSNDFVPAGRDYDAKEAKKNLAPGETDPMEEHETSRCLIERWEHLLDDLVCVLRALYSDGDREEPAGEWSKVPEHKLFLHATEDTPFFLMGTSMGGAIALLMGSILQKMVKSKGLGLCGGGLPGSHCDEDFLEKYGAGADGGLRKTCLTPALHYTDRVTDLLLRPFFIAPSSFLIDKTKDLASRASAVFTTPVQQNTMLVGSEDDVTVPGSESNMQAADGANATSGATGVGAGLEEGGTPAPGHSHSHSHNHDEEDASDGAPALLAHSSPEEQVGLPFLDASLLSVARASAGVVLMSPAISVSPPHPLLRATLDAVVAPLFPSARMPDMLRKSVDDSSSWKDPDYREYTKRDAFPHGLSYGQSIRLRTAATMLTLLDAVALEIPDMEAPFLCLMDPEDAVVSVQGVRVLMQRCGESHRMYRDDTDTDAVPAVDLAAYDVAASATATQPHVAESEGETGIGAGTAEREEEEEKEEKEADILKSNDYGRYVPVPGGGHDCLANKFDECYDATASFFKQRLASRSLDNPHEGSAGGVEL